MSNTSDNVQTAPEEIPPKDLETGNISQCATPTSNNPFALLWTRLLAWIISMYTAFAVFIAGQCNHFRSAFVFIWRAIIAFVTAQGWRDLVSTLYKGFSVFHGNQLARVFAWLFTGFWAAIATFCPTVIAGIFTVIALNYPGETTETKKIFGYILWGLTSLYLLSYYVRVLIDIVDDNVRFFFYKVTTPGGRRVFYPKTFKHIVGLVIVILAGIISYYSCFTKPSWGSYYLTLVTGLLNVLYAMLQAYGIDTNPALIEDSDQGLMSHPMQVSRRIPPFGRYVWYERVPDAVSYRVLD